MTTQKRRAKITNVQADYREKDSLGYWRSYSGHVEAKDELGEVHYFVNGSPNRVLDAKLGDRGYVEYVSTTSMSLWYWRSL